MSLHTSACAQNFGEMCDCYIDDNDRRELYSEVSGFLKRAGWERLSDGWTHPRLFKMYPMDQAYMMEIEHQFEAARRGRGG